MKPKLERRTIMRLEAGQAPVELHLVAAIAEALGCGIAPLIASLLPQEELDAETERRLLESAAYQQARAQAAALDLEMSELVPAAAALKARIGAAAHRVTGSVPAPFVEVTTIPELH